MRELIQSLSPQAHQVSWKRILGVFAFYVVVMVAAAGIFMTHQSVKKPALVSSAATVASQDAPSAAADAAAVGHIATYH